MAIIDFLGLDKKATQEQGTVISLNGSHYTCKTRKLDEVLKLLPDYDFIHWVSNGDWSMHELLLACLQYSGPADVYISSYAFSEHPARLLADLKLKGVIKQLHCLVDSRIDVRSAGALQLIRATADSCKLVNTHAKVTVIAWEHVTLSIVGSANYTTNERYEAGYVSKIAELATFHKKWMIEELIKE